MSRPGVVVTGVGLVSAAGIGVADNWRRVVAGEPTAARDPALVGCPIDFACRVPGFDASGLLGDRRAETADRFTQLAIVAAEEAMAHAGLGPDGADPTRFGVVLGTVAGGTATMEAQQAKLLREGPEAVSVRTMTMGLVSMAAGELSIRFGLRGVTMTVATACASGTNAIGIARDLIRSGKLDVALAGGADSPLTPLHSAAFHRLGALSRRTDQPLAASRPFAASRDGFVLGEGAGVLVLESDAHARARGATRLAEIAGYGTTADAYHVTRPAPAGTGAIRAMLDALTDSGLEAGDIDYVNAHGTSTRRNDEVESAAIAAVLGDGVAVSSTKGVTGHPFGAAGALEAGYSVLALRDSLLPPTANLTDPDPCVTVDLVAGAARGAKVRAVMSNSFGFGGHNACLVITAPR
ncbi:beta-ketoacyl-[acyl-carrier-protein] synthase family protein [Kutzneria sp. NPDC052558]|uniref:beta-ketoacyl-[acyl-carrier-protein] synthase family protein n=1 Tax=Kutzneria sp. NPDC052558 TaxID=3364121 RepID=UPI0037CB2BC6